MLFSSRSSLYARKKACSWSEELQLKLRGPPKLDAERRPCGLDRARRELGSAEAITGLETSIGEGFSPEDLSEPERSTHWSRRRPIDQLKSSETSTVERFLEAAFSKRGSC